MKYPFYILVVFLFLFFSSAIHSQSNEDYSVYLIGDAGEDTVPGKALLMLKEELINHPNSAVVFLGDNVYPNGLRNNDKNSELRLQSQLSILQNYKGKAYFIPGNHDWDAQGRKGTKILSNEEHYVNDYLKNFSSVENKDTPCFLPADGLPGPASVMLTDKLRLIIIDTQWFLQRYKKNKIGSKKNTKDLFYSQLDSLLNYAKDKKEQVIITAHHPIYTNGQHSKARQPLRYLINTTPLFIIGEFGLFRLFSQDIQQPVYKNMKDNILEIIEPFNNVIYVSGHEHNLQFFNLKGNKFIISGCGSKLSPLRKKKKFTSVFQDDKHTGFTKLNFDKTGNHSTVIFRENEKEMVLDGF